MIDPFAQALNELTAALDAVGIRYAVGGSLASSAHGPFRATEDGDLVAEVRPSQLAPLATRLGAGWYADVPMMESALRAGRSFNLIQMSCAFKFDIFPATTAFHGAQLDRAQLMQLRLEGSTLCRVTTAEDVLLAKLCWYRDGGEVSKHQWGDIAGLIGTHASLDQPYLQHWAGRLGVTSLLEKAFAEAPME